MNELERGVFYSGGERCEEEPKYVLTMTVVVGSLDFESFVKELTETDRRKLLNLLKEYEEC